MSLSFCTNTYYFQIISPFISSIHTPVREETLESPSWMAIMVHPGFSQVVTLLNMTCIVQGVNVLVHSQRSGNHTVTALVSHLISL